jgi:hypothetical protein
MQEKRAVVLEKALAMWLMTELPVFLRRLYKSSKPGDVICEKESVKLALRLSRWGLLEVSKTEERYSVVIA